MKASSGTSVLPFSGPAPSSNMVSSAPQSDSSASFHEVLHQQGGDSSSTSDSKSGTSTDTSSNTISTPVTTNSKATPTTATTSSTTTTPAAKAPKTTMSVVSDISAMLVQAAAAANTQKTASTATTSTTGKDASADSADDKDQSQLPTASDLAMMIAAALMAASNTTTTPVATTAAKVGDATKDAAATAQTTSTATAADLSTLIAQASILANQGGQAGTNAAADLTAKTAATVGKDLPISTTVKVVTTSATKEKKSASTSDEGTFLQSSTDATGTGSNLMGMLAAAQGQGGQSTGGQSFTSNQQDKKSPLEALAATASGTAGTANVEKKTAMNADPNIPQALSALGANTIAPANNSDMQIKLSSNNDFNDALKQVLHVAQLTQTNESRTPMRVAIEIQTPPGAVVNVYVSKQNDQWRAQLSTNDPAALSWVQDKVSSLRQSNDIGVEVRWLPPQMEATTSTSSGNNANLAWDRGGQGQSNYQQSDERQQNQQQQQQAADDLPDFASIGANFMKKLTPAGSAA